MFSKNTSRKMVPSKLMSRITLERKIFSISTTSLNLLEGLNCKLFVKITKPREKNYSNNHSCQGLLKILKKHANSTSLKYGMTSTRKSSLTKTYKKKYWNTSKSTKIFGIHQWSNICPQESNTLEKLLDSVYRAHSPTTVLKMLSKSQISIKRQVTSQSIL